MKIWSGPDKKLQVEQAREVVRTGSANKSSAVEISLVPRLRAPLGEKRSGERGRISWAYYPKRVMTNEIARSVIMTYLS